jgi:hypothetical protein
MTNTNEQETGRLTSDFDPARASMYVASMQSALVHETPQQIEARLQTEQDTDTPMFLRALQWLISSSRE